MLSLPSFAFAASAGFDDASTLAWLVLVNDVTKPASGSQADVIQKNVHRKNTFDTKTCICFIVGEIQTRFCFPAMLSVSNLE